MRKIILFLFLQMALFAKIEDLALDVVIYRGDVAGGSEYVEAVWSLNRGHLAFEKSEKLWIDTLVFHVSIEKNSTIVDSVTLTRIAAIPQGSMVSEDYFILDKFDTQLPPGEYEMTLSAFDSGDSSGAKVNKKFIVVGRKKGFSMSDIALLSSVVADTTRGMFTYNGIKMLPKPDRTYGAGFPVMFIFAEVYLPDDAGTLLVAEYSILDAKGNIEKQFPPETTVVHRKDHFILNGINVSGLPQGEWTLRLLLTEPVVKQSIEKTREFRVVKPKEIAQTKVTSVIGEDLEREFDYVEHLMTPGEISMFKSLNENGKREYLIRWWEERDPTPDTPENEYRAEVIDRFDYANEAFNERGGDKKTGWNTDRGRVFIKYGQPDNIERSSFSIDSAPYEQWDYFNVQGGVIFVFADILGIGEYKLLHSTAKGEVSDPNWGDKIMRPHDIIRVPQEQMNR